MIRSRIGIVVPIVATVFLLASGIAVGSDVDMKILSYPEHISRFSEFYVRVKIANNGKTPLHGCDKSEEKCIAVGWDFVEEESVINLPNKNIVPFPRYVERYLLPGQSIEKTVKIPTGALNGSNALVSLYLIVKEGANFNLAEQRVKMAIKPPPRHIQARRLGVRIIVYSYAALSVLMLGFLFFRYQGER
jgi:hypothetical protein